MKVKKTQDINLTTTNPLSWCQELFFIIKISFQLRIFNSNNKKNEDTNFTARDAYLMCLIVRPRLLFDVSKQPVNIKLTNNNQHESTSFTILATNLPIFRGSVLFEHMGSIRFKFVIYFDGGCSFSLFHSFLSYFNQ